MRSRNTYLAVAAFALLVILACCALPASAAEAAAPATVSAAPSGQPDASAQPAASTQPADDTNKQSKRHLVLLPTFNTYFPSNAKTRARLGDSWPSFGVSLAWRDKNTDPKKIELRLDGIAQSNDKASVLVFPIGLGISTRLTSSNNFVTYAGASANLYIGKVESVPDDVKTGWRFTGGPGAFLGANIGQRFNLQASYYAVPDIGGFGLSGFNISAHYQLF